MKSSIRYIAILAALLILAVTALVYQASDQMRNADQSAQSAREASLHSYRAAQSLKALTAGYELTMNEFYSTVLDFSAYQKKADEQRAAIAQELSDLSKLPDGDTKTIDEISKLYKDIDVYRADLEQALSGTGSQDWDRAREALYKANVLSVQAIHRADVLGKLAQDQALSLDKHWQLEGSQAQFLLRIVMALSLIAGAILIVSALLRPKSMQSA